MVFNDTVNCQIDEKGIATVQLDNPPANSLTRSLFKGMDECFDYLAGLAELRAVILTGTGKFFVAGGDIKEFLIFELKDIPDITAQGQATINKIEQLQVPVIAAINGFALGGGLEVALACDIRIASEKAKLGTPEVTLGLIPGYGGTTRLPKAINPGKARMMLYTGEFISAAEAKELGLVQEVLPPDDLLDRCLKIAECIADNAPIAVREAKKVVNEARDVSVQESLENEGKSMLVLFDSDDLKEGASAFVEKRKANFKNK